MTNLAKNDIKQTLSKLPIDLINILLVACDKDCYLSPENDVNSQNKTLKINREKLTQSILESNDCDTYNKAKELADLLTKFDDSIKAKKDELVPIAAKYKEGNAQIKKLQTEKQALIDIKAKELEETLSDEDSQKISRYNSELEKARAQLLRQKQREKGLKEYMKGLAVSLIDNLGEEYVAATDEVEERTIKTANKLQTQIQEDKQINIDTVEGTILVNQSLERVSKIFVVNAINKSKLDLESKNNIVMSRLNTQAKKPLPQKVNISG